MGKSKSKSCDQNAINWNTCNLHNGIRIHDLEPLTTKESVILSLSIYTFNKYEIKMCMCAYSKFIFEVCVISYMFISGYSVY